MKFIYHYYHSDVTQSIITRLGFAFVPDFIKNVIVSQLVSDVMCSIGFYALPEYQYNKVKVIIGSTGFHTFSPTRTTANASGAAKEKVPLACSRWLSCTRRDAAVGAEES